MQKIVKSTLSFVAFALAFVGSAMGQTQFEQAQSRLIEPKQDVFIKPLVAEIEIMEGQQRQDYGPYTYPIKSVETLTFDELENIKARALHRATKEAKGDIIVAATFKTYSDEKGKNVIVEISGFPGKYVNFRTAKKEDGDYEWITTVYPYADRINATGKTKALGNE